MEITLTSNFRRSAKESGNSNKGEAPVFLGDLLGTREQIDHIGRSVSAAKNLDGGWSKVLLVRTLDESMPFSWLAVRGRIEYRNDVDNDRVMALVGQRDILHANSWLAIRRGSALPSGQPPRQAWGFAGPTQSLRPDLTWGKFAQNRPTLKSFR
jgi:hypothetical protein